MGEGLLQKQAPVLIRYYMKRCVYKYIKVKLFLQFDAGLKFKEKDPEFSHRATDLQLIRNMPEITTEIQDIKKEEYTQLSNPPARRKCFVCN